MIGLVMCGGRGKRMGAEEEKLLLRYMEPMVQHVISALQGSGCFSRIVCATSPNAPRTSEFVRGLGVQVVETSGKGYVEDLGEALRGLGELAFVVSGDLALLDADVVKKIAAMHDSARPWTSILVTRKFLEGLGLRPEFIVRHNGMECAFTGISMVDPAAVAGGKT